MRKFLPLFVLVCIISGCDKLTQNKDAYYKIYNNNWDAESTIYGVEYDINGNIVDENLVGSVDFLQYSRAEKATTGTVSVGVKTRIYRSNRYSIATYALIPGDTIIVRVGDSWKN